MNTDIIVLAAGLGRRFNGNKLMHLIDGKPLLGYCLDLCEKLSLDGHIHSINVVASNETVISYIRDTHPDFRIILNDHPSDGLSSSIRKGILAVQSMQPSAENALLLLGDMPYLEKEHLDKLLEEIQKPNIEIVVSHEIGSKENDFRNPIVISSKFYDQLLLLTGDKGAKSILQSQYALAPKSVSGIDAPPDMLLDIDTV